MKIDYKILWIDDNISTFKEDGYIKEIEEHLINFGFEPKIILTSNRKDFINYLDDSHDLILTDFHLGSNIDGKDIINEIRNRDIFTEILFYTARGKLDDTNKIDRITFYQTSSNHYKEVVEKIKQLINLSLKKFNDVVIMRGMIMNEVSNLDEIKLDIINDFIKNADENNIINIKDTILEQAEKHFNNKIEDIKKWQVNANGFNNLIKDNFVFSSNYKIQTISYILKLLEIEDFTDNYKKDIIETRNKFAHAKLIEDKNENGELIRKYFKDRYDGLNFDDELCKKIRINITKYKRQLESILAISQDRNRKKENR